MIRHLLTKELPEFTDEEDTMKESLIVHKGLEEEMHNGVQRSVNFIYAKGMVDVFPMSINVVIQLSFQSQREIMITWIEGLKDSVPQLENASQEHNGTHANLSRQHPS